MASSLPVSIADVERLLVEKTKRLESLIEQRDKLRQQIDDLDQQIQEAGNLTGDPRRGRRRHTNTAPLRQFVLEVLQNHKSGLGIAELTAQVLAAGYKSQSHRPENVVHQCLYNTPEIQRNSQTKSYFLQK
ncbi:MAG: hypothetical protein JWP89_2350 [Schlesneria sp.]|nr:hypothetical protein [Schlesneria sp.]